MANVNDLVNGGYVTIFNRAADPAGAAFWITTTGLPATQTVTLAANLNLIELAGCEHVRELGRRSGFQQHVSGEHVR